MEWNGSPVGSILRPFLDAHPENPLAFLYSFNNQQHPSPPAGLEVRHNNNSSERNDNNYYMQDKKKRLTCDQLESLERSFLKEIKLDPDRKMRLARELGLQPRQVAVWFQNRRARWKNKQLECLYESLKQEYDVVSREKQSLQNEVVKLQGMLREQGVMRQSSTVGFNNEVMSGDQESIESAARVVTRPQPPPSLTESQQLEEAKYFQNADRYTPILLVQPSYWQGGGSHQLPPYP